MPPLVFSTTQYAYLGDELCRRGGYEAGGLERRRFADGEDYLRLKGSLVDRDAVVVGGTVDDAATLELYDLACALVTAGARRLTLAVPYFGYATMERAVLAGEVVKAKTRARLLSSVPRPPRGVRLLLLDLHSEGIPYYFEGDVDPVHVYGKRLVREAATALAAGEEFVLASTDAGRAKWVESLANDLGVGAAFVFKRRIDDRRTEITGISADVRGRVVVIYDDMIRTGGSLVQAAEAYRAAGATKLYAICTHGVLPGDALARIRARGVLGAVVATDSHPRARSLADGYLRVVSCADLFLPYLDVGPGGESGPSAGRSP